METSALVFGPYTAIRPIGRGGMGVVYEARHPARRQERLALKAIHQPADDEGGVVTRFLREVRALKEVRHDHVVRLVDSGIADGRPFIVMDFLEGESLADLLA